MENTTLSKERDILACVRALAGDRATEISNATRSNQPELARALSAYSAASGGFAVPETYAEGLIESLRPRVAVRKLNPVVIPMPHGNLTWPRINVGGTAAYLEEGSTINASAYSNVLVNGLPALPNAAYPVGTIVQNILNSGIYANVGGAWIAVNSSQQFGSVQLTARKLVSLVPISNQFLRYASPAGDVIVKEDLTAAIAAIEDYFLLRGDGTQSTPVGLRNLALPASVVAFSGSQDIPTIEAALTNMEFLLINAGVKMTRPAYVMSPRTEAFLSGLRNPTSGIKAFPEMAERGMLRGKPYVSTTNVPTNLGTGSNQSEIYLADFAEVVIGEYPLIINIANAGSYVDAAGNTVSLFSQDQSAIRVICQSDINLRHQQAVAVLTAVPF